MRPVLAQCKDPVVASSCPIYLVPGKQWVFAAAVDWPGWARRGKTEESAVETLLDYESRYRLVVGEVFKPGKAEVIGRLPSDASTDFGVLSGIGPWDDGRLPAANRARLLEILGSCWGYFDSVSARAPAELRKGPRGGGRDTAKIVAHVGDAEKAYARKIGTRIAKEADAVAQRQMITAALASPGDEAAWPTRYAIRRIAWHALDHAWEIEDRSEP
jgi:hypothetical protein